MPEKTVMPIDLRALAPAPVATTSGATGTGENRFSMSWIPAICCDIWDWISWQSVDVQRSPLTTRVM